MLSGVTAGGQFILFNFLDFFLFLELCVCALSVEVYYLPNLLDSFTRMFDNKRPSKLIVVFQG